MENKIGNYEVSVELNEIKNLLFLMSDDFDEIKTEAIKYQKKEENLLSYATNRNIDRLVTLQRIIFDKVSELEKNFE